MTSLHVDSPNPSPAVQWEVWQILKGALDSLGPNDFGRPWPNPRRDVLADLLAEYPADLCITAARETREIVQSQDRAPNVTSLFAKKCADLAVRRLAIRDEVRKALA